jgi:nickel transport protein
VYSPADPKLPHQKGRTDRDGWLAFVPATPGAWRVKVFDQTGHGLDVAIEAARAPGAAQVASSGAAPASTAAFVLRPLVGLAAIGGVFGALLALHRRKRTSP